MHCIRVNLGERSYDIAINDNDWLGVGAFVQRLGLGKRAFVVTDLHVQAHAERVGQALNSAGFEVGQQVLPAGEAQKCLASASRLYDCLADSNADRKTLIVAVGGGVIGDLAGFVAATYNRGLPLLMAPTSLLAMVDSSVGGKVGINHPKAKNLIGAFHQPVGVWIDLPFLATLPDREFRSGLAEVVKYGVSLDADLFAFLEGQTESILNRAPGPLQHIIARSCELKAAIVEQDEREQMGLRAVLNYGHTFGHAFEAVGGYGAWLHGEAIATGMICAARLAEKRGLISGDVVHRQRRLLERLGLRLSPLDWSVDQLLAAMRRDKKNVAGRLRFVLPYQLGAARLVEGISEVEVKSVLDEVLAGGA
ncbi:MAG: 3-dehydroquinate synthase [Gemmataceae bacterium]